MKTQILILFFSLLTLGVNAEGNPIMKATSTKSLVINPSLWKSSHVNVTIREEISGNILLNEKVGTHQNMRSYNLKNLSDGAYTLELSDALKIQSQTFIIQSDVLSLSKDITTEYKPVNTWDGKCMNLNFLTLGRETTLSIEDKDNNVVFAEKFKASAIHKRYDLRKLTSGVYTVTVKSGNRTYYLGNQKI
ncbi:MAG: hypothetical protein IPL08_07270 [Saprospiraceae bacterium]|nr:hypothetical protein [Saprospiraceae bacterium]MBK8668135.1 hypothetical protein [Saprospiraceae bacterium]